MTPLLFLLLFTGNYQQATLLSRTNPRVSPATDQKMQRNNSKRGSRGIISNA
jgi:hypothetical protein